MLDKLIGHHFEIVHHRCYMNYLNLKSVKDTCNLKEFSCWDFSPGLDSFIYKFKTLLFYNQTKNKTFEFNIWNLRFLYLIKNSHLIFSYIE